MIGPWTAQRSPRRKTPQRALTSYEQLLAAGIENAKLYYNVENIHFRLNDLGRAIVSYRRGLRLEPDNPRLQANLGYALSLRVDKIEVSQRVSWLSQILFWHDALPLGSQFSLAVGSFVLAWVCAFVRLFWRRPSLGWLLGGLVCFCVLFSSSSLLVHFQHTTTGHGVIVAQAWRTSARAMARVMPCSYPSHYTAAPNFSSR